jgi:hypothetical protein
VPIASVDEFVEAKVRPELRPVVAMLRELMREVAPEATEAYAYAMPVWHRRNIIAWITVAGQHISFGFTHGTEIDDPYGLLGGRGKGARNVRLKRLDAVNRDALCHYVRQALELDAR